MSSTLTNLLDHIVLSKKTTSRSSPHRSARTFTNTYPRTASRLKEPPEASFQVNQQRPPRLAFPNGKHPPPQPAERRRLRLSRAALSER